METALRNYHQHAGKNRNSRLELKMSSVLKPVDSEKLQKFMKHVLFEERGSRYGRCIFIREDKNRPISFQETGIVPIVEITRIIRYLEISPEKYLAIMDGLFPESY